MARGLAGGKQGDGPSWLPGPEEAAGSPDFSNENGVIPGEPG